MDELYLETGNKKERINNEAVEKYHLEPGTLSPFTQNRIVEKDGVHHEKRNSDKDSETQIRQEFDNMPLQGSKNDGIDGMDNGFELSQSEIIDFSQGVDSRMDENQ